jgi:ATP-dependent DNA helicase RecG
MPAVSDAELERLLSDHESDRVERKESLKNSADEVRQAICAFANDLPDRRQPGVVVIGLRDNGQPSGLPITDELLRRLADMRGDGNILPVPELVVEKRHLRGVDLAVVTVMPSNSPPVSFKGIIWIRVGPRRARATQQEESRLAEKRRSGDVPFDLRAAPRATLADLNLLRFQQEYLPRAVDPEVLAANARTDIQRLLASKMLHSEEPATPTYLGLLLLCEHSRNFLPGAYIQFLRVAGRSLADPIIDERLIEGPLSEQIRKISDSLRAHLRTAIEITGGLQERRSSSYPEAALVQLVTNAVMHRTYEHTNTPVRITWYQDRIEIISPGGPYGRVTYENFGRPGYTDYRNPNIAEALKVLGFVQRFGAGIEIARAAMMTAGLPAPEFSVEQGFVAVVLRGAP